VEIGRIIMTVETKHDMEEEDFETLLFSDLVYKFESVCVCVCV